MYIRNMKTNTTHDLSAYQEAAKLIIGYELDNDEYTKKLFDNLMSMDHRMAVKILLASYEVLLAYSKKQEVIIESLKSLYK